MKLDGLFDGIFRRHCVDCEGYSDESHIINNEEIGICEGKRYFPRISLQWLWEKMKTRIIEIGYTTGLKL